MLNSNFNETIAIPLPILLPAATGNKENTLVFVEPVLRRGAKLDEACNLLLVGLSADQILLSQNFENKRANVENIGGVAHHLRLAHEHLRRDAGADQGRTINSFLECLREIDHAQCFSDFWQLPTRNIW